MPHTDDRRPMSGASTATSISNAGQDAQLRPTAVRDAPGRPRGPADHAPAPAGGRPHLLPGAGGEVLGREGRWSWAAVGVSLAATALALVFHEPWRDEWQAWLLAENSSSLRDLLADVRREGHPPLWHILLFGLSRVGPVELMRVLTGAAAIASTAVVARYGPFRTWQKPLFALGYFSAFEYLAISRPYALAMLLVFSYAALSWSSTRDHTVSRSVLIALLTLTSIYGAMVAMVLGAAAVVGRRSGHRSRQLVPAAAAVVGTVLSLVLARPAPGTTGRYSSERLTDPFTGLDPNRLQLREALEVLVPIPAVGSDRWWGTSIVDSPNGVVVALVALIALAAVAFAVRRSRVALGMWVLGVVGLLLFGYVVYPGAIYHYGHLYLIAVAAIWFASSRSPGTVDRRIVVALLGAQALGGVVALALDATGPFSNGDRVAGAVRADELVVVDPDWLGTTIAGESGRSVFMVTSNRHGTFVQWDQARECQRDSHPLCLELDEVLARAERAGGDVLVLPPGARLPVAAPWRRVEVFTGAATGEDLAVYRRRDHGR